MKDKIEKRNPFRVGNEFIHGHVGNDLIKALNVRFREMQASGWDVGYSDGQKIGFKNGYGQLIEEREADDYNEGFNDGLSKTIYNITVTTRPALKAVTFRKVAVITNDKRSGGLMLLIRAGNLSARLKTTKEVCGLKDMINNDGTILNECLYDHPVLIPVNGMLGLPTIDDQVVMLASLIDNLWILTISDRISRDIQTTIITSEMVTDMQLLCDAWLGGDQNYVE